MSEQNQRQNHAPSTKASVASIELIHHISTSPPVLRQHAIYRRPPPSLHRQLIIAMEAVYLWKN